MKAGDLVRVVYSSAILAASAFTKTQQFSCVILLSCSAPKPSPALSPDAPETSRIWYTDNGAYWEYNLQPFDFMVGDVVEIIGEMNNYHDESDLPNTIGKVGIITTVSPLSSTVRVGFSEEIKYKSGTLSQTNWWYKKDALKWVEYKGNGTSPPKPTVKPTKAYKCINNKAMGVVRV